MKITYAPNPLDTIVELDEHEIEIFRLKLKLEQYEDMMFGAHWAITERLKDMGGLKALSLDAALDEARRELDPKKWCTDGESQVDARVEELLQHYLEELRLSHMGDCICAACTCSKCHAEHVLGVQTLKPFPGKHVLHKIATTFSRWNQATGKHDGPEVTLDQAIERLAGYDPQPPENMSIWDKVGGFFSHVPRWKTEAKEAHDYLVAYRDTHFRKD